MPCRPRGFAGAVAILVLAGLLAVSAAVHAASGPAPRMERVTLDPRDLGSLQRGARLFVNYCLNCHSAKYMRYNRLADLDLTEGAITENLILSGQFSEANDGTPQFAPTKIGESMHVAMRPADAKLWFGAPPPDLSVEARVRGTEWLYNYLIGFYRDDASVTGWNNLVFPNVGMPHALWELSGIYRVKSAEFTARAEAEGAAIAAKALAVVEPAPDHKYLMKTLVLATPGTMSPGEYRAAVGDLVNFLDYVGEPAKTTRVRMGIVVLLFLGILFVSVYWLKRAYWKDLH